MTQEELNKIYNDKFDHIREQRMTEIACNWVDLIKPMCLETWNETYNPPGLLKRIIRNRRRTGPSDGRDGNYWYKFQNGRAYEWKYGKWMYKSKSFVSPSK